jgi:hypothetical protein
MSFAKRRYSKERNAYLIKIYWEYRDDKPDLFPCPADMEAALEMYIKYCDKANKYCSVCWWAIYLKASLFTVTKYKNKEWFQEIYEEAKEIFKNSLIEKTLMKEYDPKMARLLLSHDYWIVEKNISELNVKGILPMSMLIQKPWESDDYDNDWEEIEEPSQFLEV